MAQIQIEDIHVYLTKAQIIHLQEMDPEIFPKSVKMASSLIKSQIGGLYKIQKILDELYEEDSAEIIKWFLTVFTAWYMGSSASQVSEPLHNDYKIAMDKLAEIKSGATVLVDAPHQNPCYTWGTIISKRWKNRG